MRRWREKKHHLFDHISKKYLQIEREAPERKRMTKKSISFEIVRKKMLNSIIWIDGSWSLNIVAFRCLCWSSSKRKSKCLSFLLLVWRFLFEDLTWSYFSPRWFPIRRSTDEQKVRKSLWTLCKHRLWNENDKNHSLLLVDHGKL